MKSNNKLIAKNAIYMYLRMLVVITISMITTRLVILKLGIEDYGIYSIVSGILVFLSFINGSLSLASVRFITFEIGKENNKNRINDTFSSCLFIHIAISITVSIVCLIICPYLIKNQLIIPTERLTAAQFVFYFSVISVAIQILQTPFTSLIIAHERFNIIAIIEVLNAFFKLIIVYLLYFSTIDRLVLYAGLFTLTTIIIFLITCCYCLTVFEDYRIKICTNKEILLPILKYTGWQLYGNFSVVAITQGINFLLNINFGPKMNAAYDISAKVSAIVLGLSSNISSVVTPQITKSYSASNNTRTISLMKFTSKIMLLMMLYVCVPLIIECQYVLKLWLETPPPHVVTILRFMLVWNIIVSMNYSLSIVSNATGDLKISSIISGTMYLSVFVISYVSYKFNAPYWVPFLYNVIFVMFSPLYCMPPIKKHIKSFSWFKDMFSTQVKEYLIIGTLIFIIYYTSLLQEASFIRLVTTTLISCLIISLLFFFFIFSSKERTRIIEIVRNRYNKLKS